MKAVLLIDMPTTCAGCPCYDYIHGVCAITYKDCELRKRAKPEWCPLRPLPPKLDANDCHRMFSGRFSERELKGYGWNACLYAIVVEAGEYDAVD